MRPVCRLLVVLLLALMPATAHAAGAVGGAPDQLTPLQTQRLVTAASREALALANRAPEVTAERRNGDLQAFVDPLGGTKWRVRYSHGAEAVLEVDVDLKTRQIDAVWTGTRVDFPMARGYPGWFGGHVTAPYIWLPLCLGFLVLFVDRRRLLSLGNLDLLAILGFGISQWFFQRGDIDVSVPLSYLPLLYLLARMVAIGVGRARSGGVRLAVGLRTATVVLVLVVIARIALNVFDTNDHEYIGWGLAGTTVTDVGYAGVAGADRLQQGLPLYTETAHLDTYGPLNYVAYIPFERIWPYHGDWDSLPAAHAAAIAFDLLTILGLIFLGRRLLGRGREGNTLGVGLACAWALCPYSTYVMNANTNDALVAAALVWALVFFGSSLVRGLVLGLGAAAKFIPAALLPPLLWVKGERGLRPALLCGGAFVAVLVGSAFAFAPPEGVGLVWRHTVARQAGAASPFSIWGMWDAIEFLRPAIELLVLAGAGLAVLRVRATVAQAAAIGAVLIIGVEITALHWIYFYIVWFLPLVLVALIAPHLDSGA